MIFRTENGKAEDIKMKDSGRAGMTEEKITERQKRLGFIYDS
jgi:hypothetical protein